MAENQYSQFTEKLLVGTKCRPVTIEDTWCRKGISYKQGQLYQNWGYILTLPRIPKENANIIDIQGYIIRCKLKDGELLLQIIPQKKYVSYSIVYHMPKKWSIQRTS